MTFGKFNKYLVLLSLLILLSCTNGVSDAEETFIKSKILLHNKAFLHFVLDSLNRRTSLRAKILFETRDQARADRYADSVMRMLYKKENNPYDPRFDSNLSFERFMAFCKLNAIDPVKMANKLREK